MDLTEVSREILNPVRDLGEYIRTQRTAAQISLRALASKAGVSNPSLSQVERGLRRPSAAILAQIADGLSISAESLLVKAGILRAAEATPVITAIRADEELSERQKSSLIDIYLALRHEAQSRREPGGSASRPHPADPHDPGESAPTDQHATTATPTEE
jgi:transcriptional regulator with XRE-family HTH domain